MNTENLEIDCSHWDMEGYARQPEADYMEPVNETPKIEPLADTSWGFSHTIRLQIQRVHIAAIGVVPSLDRALWENDHKTWLVAHGVRP